MAFDRAETRKRTRHGLLLGACALLCALCLSQKTAFAAADDTADGANGPDAALAQFRMEDLEAAVRSMQPGPERDYFAGVLANRSGQVEESARLLDGALPAIRPSQTRTAFALLALADDYTKLFRYADAARVYDELLALPLAQPANRPRQDVEDDARMAHLLSGTPAQTISWRGKTRLKITRSALGSLDTELTVNGVRGEWMLDTGSATCVVSRTFAQRLGLQPLPGYGQAKAGVTGIENPLQVAVLPTLRMGGATLHNVVAVIFDDASLRINAGKRSYQINAIIGDTVFQALGAVSFFQNGWIEAGDGAQRAGDGAGTRMYMDLLTPVIECGIGGVELPFSFDTGGTSTALTARYFQRFRNQTTGEAWLRGENTSAGVGGVVKRPIYFQHRLDLTVGDKTATLGGLTIFPAPMGSNLDDLYGNLGEDAFASFASFTLDFAKMTFTLGKPLARH